MADSKNGTAALAYAARLNWKVFPCYSVGENRVCSCGDMACNSPGKHPRAENGFKAATTDEGIIRQWWTQGPDANIGVATGAASGFDVLDVDPRHGGNESLEDLEGTTGHSGTTDWRRWPAHSVQAP